MTQDQFGQTRGPGYVVRDEVVPGNETEEFPTGSSKPMTRFQKVASALRGGGPEQDDYWDEPRGPAAGRDEAVAVTSPAAPVTETGSDPLTRQDELTGSDHQATQPDMFGTTAHAGNGATSANDGPAGGVPGEGTGTMGDFSDLTYGNLIPDAAQYTDQWQQVQFKFVDDPHTSVTEAADIVAQVTAKLEAAIQERQRSLRGRWGEGANADTEALRETLRMYRTFLDQLIGPRAS